MKTKFLFLFLFVTTISFSQLDTSSSTSSPEDKYLTEYNNLANSINTSKINDKSTPQLVEANIIYVSKPTYTTFLGFVTMRYTICYDTSPCRNVVNTWWCGCSKFGPNVE